MAFATQAVPLPACRELSGKGHWVEGLWPAAVNLHTSAEALAPGLSM
jgi:hypothetical protein